MSQTDVHQIISWLEALARDPNLLVSLKDDERIALLKATGQISRPHKDEIRVRNKALQKVRRQKVVRADREARANTGIRLARLNRVFEAPQQIKLLGPGTSELLESRNCYVCKAEFRELHHFYDSMCMPCAEFNYQKRFQTASMHDQIVLITGARLKIGYQSALMMLRAGAQVIVTTRFPVDAALRFSKEKDYSEWATRIQVHGLDLRHIPSVEIFCRYLEQTLPRLDVLINNAAQTVRRPPGFYSHLMAAENLPYAELPKAVQNILRTHEVCKRELNLLNAGPSDASGLVAWQSPAPGVGLRHSAQLSLIPYSFDHSLNSKDVFPEGQLDADLQQVDLRKTNSWRMRLAEVPTAELLEVQLINSIAPFVLCNHLIPLMRRHTTGQKHIVNVSAMEGKFYRFVKTDRHPHTNIAKAALNMLTHTSASGLAKEGIFMNAVDTGWVTDEDPFELARAKEKVHDFQPPLDIVDGAARVCDPFFDGINTGQHWSGKFLKDYKPIDW